MSDIAFHFEGVFFFLGAALTTAIGLFGVLGGVVAAAVMPAPEPGSGQKPLRLWQRVAGPGACLAVGVLACVVDRALHGSDAGRRTLALLDTAFFGAPLLGFGTRYAVGRAVAPAAGKTPG